MAHRLAEFRCIPVSCFWNRVSGASLDLACIRRFVGDRPLYLLVVRLQLVSECESGHRGVTTEIM